MSNIKNGIHHKVYFKYTFSVQQSQTRPLKTIHIFTRKSFSLNKNHYHAHCVQLEMKHDYSQIPVCQQLQQDNLSDHLKGLFSLSSGQAALLKPSPGGCVCLSCCSSVPVWCLSRRFEGLQSLLIARALGHDKKGRRILFIVLLHSIRIHILF